MFNENDYIIEEVNDDDNNQIHNSHRTSNVSEQYKRIINQLSNENNMLKSILEEKMKIIEIFQKVTIEAKDKIDLLINENKKLIDENNRFKENIKLIEKEKKEELKNLNFKLQNELNLLKEELNTIQNYYNNQLKKKENYINNLKNNLQSVEAQYQQTLNSTLNNLSNNFVSRNNRALSSSHSKSILLDNREEKYSFYSNFNIKPLSNLDNLNNYNQRSNTNILNTSPRNTNFN
jgi:hypothetical protein